MTIKYLLIEFILNVIKYKLQFLFKINGRKHLIEDKIILILCSIDVKQHLKTLVKRTEIFILESVLNNLIIPLVR